MACGFWGDLGVLTLNPISPKPGVSGLNPYPSALNPERLFFGLGFRVWGFVFSGWGFAFEVWGLELGRED